MKVVNLKPDQIKPYPNNPRKNKEAVKKAKESIKRYGFRNPILLDGDGVIIAGHTRYLASLELKLQEVPCIINTDLTPAQVKEYRIADNRVGEFSEWDRDVLKLELMESDQELLDFLGFDFLPDDKETEGLTDQDEVPDVEESICNVGDLWKLGEHRLLCGDATSKADMKLLMNGTKADMIFTDPPYGVSYKGTNNPNGREWKIIDGDNLRGDALYELIFGSLQNLFKHSIENPAVYVWHASANQMLFEKAINDAGFEVKEQIIWNKGMVLGHSDYHWTHEPCFYIRKQGKNNEWFGDRKQKTILRKETVDLNKLKKGDLINILKTLMDDTTSWEIKKDSPKFYMHPTQKPVDLCIKASVNNTKEGMVIADSFLGSGSTLIGCEKIARKCYGMELSPHYCDVIIRRWEDFTGKKAELLNGGR